MLCLQEPLPAKLLNNAAVLSMRAGRAPEALVLLEEAFQVRPETCYSKPGNRGTDWHA